MNHAARVERLRPLLEEPLLVTDPVNVRYLTGFVSSNAALLVDEERVRLYTDFRYARAAEAVEGVELVEAGRHLVDDLAGRLSGRIGFESTHLTYRAYETLVGGGLEPVPRAGLVERLRAVKDGEELDRIRRAVAITDAAFERLAEERLVGRSEREVAWRLETLLREGGGEATAFPVVVAAGPTGSTPHAKPGDRTIEAGETIVIGSVIVLFVLHVGLYWLNVLWVERNDRWFLFYYPAQTAVMLGIVWLLHSRSEAGLSFLFSATIAIIGEGLGVWGRTRRAFSIGVFYVGLLLGFLYLFSDRATLLDSVTGLLVNGGSIILFMVMFNQLFAERQKAIELAESLESANAKLAAYNAKIESLTLQNERQRMARELHDTLAQGVAGLILQLEAVKVHLASNRAARAASIVEQTLTRARSTLAESRAAIDDLRAASTNVADAVREQVERFKQSTGVACDMELSVTEHELDPEVIDHAMLILSESLTNISRHA